MREFINSKAIATGVRPLVGCTTGRPEGVVVNGSCVTFVKPPKRGEVE